MPRYTENPRVAEIMRGRPLHERLMVGLFAMTVGEAGVNEVLRTISGAPAANHGFVIPETGMPLIHYIGKDRKTLQSELRDAEKVDAVAKALTDNGFTVDEQPAPVDPNQQTNATAVARDKAAALASDNAAPVENPGGFGVDQFPASELWHMSDEELLNVDGITPSDVREIRAQQEAAEKVNEANANQNPAPPADNPPPAPPANNPAPPPPPPAK